MVRRHVRELVVARDRDAGAIDDERRDGIARGRRDRERLIRAFHNSHGPARTDGAVGTRAGGDDPAIDREAGVAGIARHMPGPIMGGDSHARLGRRCVRHGPRVRARVRDPGRDRHVVGAAVAGPGQIDRRHSHVVGGAPRDGMSRACFPGLGSVRRLRRDAGRGVQVRAARGPLRGVLEQQAVTAAGLAPAIEDAAVARCRGSVVGRRAVSDPHHAPVAVDGVGHHQIRGSVDLARHPDVARDRGVDRGIQHDRRAIVERDAVGHSVGPMNDRVRE